MKGNIDLKPYSADVVVSPATFSGEHKDQDRARFSEPGQMAFLCDGVTSSPNSTEAAELGTSLGPILFKDTNSHRLDILCDLLKTRRQECQQSEPIILSEDMPEAMQQMLGEAVRKKRKTAFQTTLVAAKFISNSKHVLTQILRCGDSAFFACLSDGELLRSSLSFVEEPQTENNHSGRAESRPTASKEMRFGPGDEILVRVYGPLTAHRSLAVKAGIRSKHRQNWLVCSPADSCHCEDEANGSNPGESRVLLLKSADRLLVPKFLYGAQLTCKGLQLRVLRYSSTIRRVSENDSFGPVTSFGNHGSATNVLPDHFDCGAYDFFQDRFPLGTHFVLCSDGFYSSFEKWPELWTWLQKNAADLQEKAKRQQVLENLHRQLHARGGDDDISFVWVKPNDSRKGG